MRLIALMGAWIRRLLWVVAVTGLAAAAIDSVARWRGINDVPRVSDCADLPISEAALDGVWVELQGCTVLLSDTEPGDGDRYTVPLLDPDGLVVGVASIDSTRLDEVRRAQESGGAPPPLSGMARRPRMGDSPPQCDVPGCYVLQVDQRPDWGTSMTLYLAAAAIAAFLGWRTFRRYPRRAMAGVDVQWIAATLGALRGPRIIAMATVLSMAIVFLVLFALLSQLFLGERLEGGASLLLFIIPLICFGPLLGLGYLMARAWEWNPPLWCRMGGVMAALCAAASLALMGRDPALATAGVLAWAVVAFLLFRWARVFTQVRRFHEPRLGFSGENLERIPPPSMPPLSGRRSFRDAVLLGMTWMIRGVGLVFLVGSSALSDFFPPLFLITRPLMHLALRFAGYTSLLRRRYASPAARAVLEADRRPPCLLLRSFVDDGMRRPLSLAQLATIGLATVEESLATLLWAYGPVIAIGKPGERLPHAGAAREYVGHEQWRTRVQELASRARLLFVVVGPTPGLAWELRAIQENGWWDKTILWIPPHSPHDARRRGKIICDALAGTPLAERLSTLDWPLVRALVFRDNVPVPILASWSAYHSAFTAADLALRSAARPPQQSAVPLAGNIADAHPPAAQRA